MIYIRLILSAIKGLFFKRKFKAYFLFITDHRHRSAVMFIRRNMNGKKPNRIIHIPIGLITPSHGIIYYGWVRRLVTDIRYNGLNTNPIDVFKCCGKYYIADGHHRCAANYAVYGLRHKLEVRVFE